MSDYSRRVGKLSAHLTWIIGLGLLTLVFNAYLEEKYNPNAHLITAQTGTEVRLQSDGRGHYQAPGWINGVPVHFLVDTGATYVSLSDELAAKLSLVPEGSAWVDTANGRVQAQRARLQSVRLGGIEMRNVGAMITPGISGQAVLLGMSFLQELQLTQHNGELTLRVP